MMFFIKLMDFVSTLSLTDSASDTFTFISDNFKFRIDKFNAH